MVSIVLIILGLVLISWGFKQENSDLKVADLSQPTSTTFLEPGLDPEMVREGYKGKVVRVIDGDTIEIEGGVKVRLIGVDTPESVDPRRAVECFGKEAALESESLLLGKTIFLMKDISETDKYNRLLRYVFVESEDGKLLFVNDFLVRQGFATVATFPPDVKYSQQFLNAQEEARQAKRGLWQKC